MAMVRILLWVMFFVITHININSKQKTTIGLFCRTIHILLFLVTFGFAELFLTEPSVRNSNVCYIGLETVPTLYY
jgi:hypothetical protein